MYRPGSSWQLCGCKSSGCIIIVLHDILLVKTNPLTSDKSQDSHLHSRQQSRHVSYTELRQLQRNTAMNIKPVLLVIVLVLGMVSAAPQGTAWHRHYPGERHYGATHYRLHDFGKTGFHIAYDGLPRHHSHPHAALETPQ
ncbi:uncharacterized protein [Cherax quadricarinatus]|uniref:uncharacterized protein isoform X2 n=1 Tax=Cherax quadricarinatus TaxID=27406 RepID=UPI00387EC8DA